MIATIWPGSTACAAGAVTWASTLPTATAMPSGSPVQPAASAVRTPAAWPSCADGLLELVGDEPREAGVQRGEELRVGVGAVLQDALVPGRCRRCGRSVPHSRHTIQSAASTQRSIAA